MWDCFTYYYYYYYYYYCNCFTILWDSTKISYAKLKIKNKKFPAKPNRFEKQKEPTVHSFSLHKHSCTLQPKKPFFLQLARVKRHPLFQWRNKTPTPTASSRPISKSRPLLLHLHHHHHHHYSHPIVLTLLLFNSKTESSSASSVPALSAAAAATHGSSPSSWSFTSLPSSPPCLSMTAGTIPTKTAPSSCLGGSLFSLSLRIPCLVLLLPREFFQF